MSTLYYIRPHFFLNAYDELQDYGMGGVPCHAQTVIFKITQCIPVVTVFAFLRSKSGISELTLEEIDHSWMDTT